MTAAAAPDDGSPRPPPVSAGGPTGLHAARVEAAVALLGAGWAGLQHRSLPAEPEHPATWIDWTLLHPDRGVMLLEVAPGLVPEAAPRLRRGLDAARFRQIYAGHLPIAHPSLSTALAPAELAARLVLALEREAPPMLPGGDAWTGTLHRVLAQAGDGDGQPRALPGVPVPMTAAKAPTRRRRRQQRGHGGRALP
jgi:hypothetical protein